MSSQGIEQRLTTYRGIMGTRTNFVGDDATVGDTRMCFSVVRSPGRCDAGAEFTALDPHGRHVSLGAMLSSHAFHSFDCATVASIALATFRASYCPDRSGTFEKSEPSPSTIVGSARMASHTLVEGRPASIAVCTTATVSRLGQRVAASRRRRSTNASSGTLPMNGRIDVS